MVGSESGPCVSRVHVRACASGKLLFQAHDVAMWRCLAARHMYSDRADELLQWVLPAYHVQDGRVDIAVYFLHGNTPRGERERCGCWVAGGGVSTRARADALLAMFYKTCDLAALLLQGGTGVGCVWGVGLRDWLCASVCVRRLCVRRGAQL